MDTAHNNTAHLTLVMPPSGVPVERILFPEMERSVIRDGSAFTEALRALRAIQVPEADRDNN